MSRHITECPREESNLRTRFRKPLLYPLSYEGRGPEGEARATRPEGPKAPSEKSSDVKVEGRLGLANVLPCAT